MKRIFSLICILLASAFILAACASSPHTGDTTSAPVNTPDQATPAPPTDAPTVRPADDTYDRKGLDLSGIAFTPESAGMVISADELTAPLAANEIKLRRFYAAQNGAYPEGDWSAGYSFTFEPRSEAAPAPDEYNFGGTRISFLVWNTDPVGFLTSDPMSEKADLAFAYSVLAKAHFTALDGREYRDPYTNLYCYIENEGDETDVFAFTDDLYILHKTGSAGEAYPLSEFTEISAEPLSEPDYMHLFALFVRYLDTDRESLSICDPMRRESYDEDPDAITVVIGEGGKETVITERADKQFLLDAIRGENNQFSCNTHWTVSDEPQAEGIVFTVYKGTAEDGQKLSEFTLLDDGRILLEVKFQYFSTLLGSWYGTQAYAAYRPITEKAFDRSAIIGHFGLDAGK